MTRTTDEIINSIFHKQTMNQKLDEIEEEFLKDKKDCTRRRMIKGTFRYCNCNCGVCKNFKCGWHKE